MPSGCASRGEAPVRGRPRREPAWEPCRRVAPLAPWTRWISVVAVSLPLRSILRRNCGRSLAGRTTGTNHHGNSHKIALATGGLPENRRRGEQNARESPAALISIGMAIRLVVLGCESPSTRPRVDRPTETHRNRKGAPRAAGRTRRLVRTRRPTVHPTPPRRHPVPPRQAVKTQDVGFRIGSRSSM
jgi:hypothetical protein